MSKPTIFIIDDEAALRDSLTALLKASGFHADTYASAEEFLGAYDAAMEGCILLDIVMPGMDGFGLIEELSAKGINMPVIIISGYSNNTLVNEALQKGAVDFIQKPFKEEVLLEAIQRALGTGEQNPVGEASSE